MPLPQFPLKRGRASPQFIRRGAGAAATEARWDALATKEDVQAMATKEDVQTLTDFIYKKWGDRVELKGGGAISPPLSGGATVEKRKGDS